MIPNFLFIIVLGILTGILTFLTTRGNLVDRRKRGFLKKLNNRGKLVIVILILITVALIGQEANNGYAQKQSTKNFLSVVHERDSLLSLDLNQSMDSLNTINKKFSLQIDSLVHNNTILKNNLFKIQNQNGRLSNKLIESYESLLNNITGGDSYCFLSLKNLTHRLEFATVFNQQKFPMYDVTMTIRDISKLNLINTSDLDLNALDDSSRTYNIGVLKPMSGKRIPTPRLDLSKDSLTIQVEFSARNGFHSQIIRLKKRNNMWYTSSVVYRNFPEFQELYSFKDEEFDS
ncbi:hypothetical protein [Croceitalea rosinachiae]|uniref:Uncharacterized protein n=1 Tax=Croceitalea rosinachiae TaxID=3075596 RepID=A0ABU3ACZ1_9FLAO|nr:hypothetical protein [Croceitalea sp. F388]MDT0608046.1 hypothetical protein [Croceitalea sp. F388]